jgi:hypothetical protein
MRTRITRVGQQRIDRAVFDLQVWRHGIEKPTERCRRAGWKYSGGGNLFFRAVAIEISRCCPRILFWPGRTHRFSAGLRNNTIGIGHQQFAFSRTWRS